MFGKFQLTSVLRSVLGGSAERATASIERREPALASIKERVGDVDAAAESSGIESEEAKRCLAILIADQLRCGELAPERVDSLAEKRQLDATDRAWLYRQLGMGTGDASETSEEDVSDDVAGLDGDEVEATPERTEDHVTFLLKSVAGNKFLSAEDERILGRQIRNGINLREAMEAGTIREDAAVKDAIARGEDAHRRMVLSNVRLVVSVARKYEGWSSLDLSDLVQEGLVGLMKAIDRYDPDLGLKLSTYATWWIRQSITRAIHDTGKTIRFPVYIAEKIAKLRKTERRLNASTGSAPTIAKLAAELGWGVEETEEIYAHSQMSYASIDDERDEEDDHRRAPVLVDTAPSPQEILEAVEMRKAVREVVATLPLREGEIIERRFGLGPTSDEETLAEIGDDKGLTRERIRQIEAKALRRLRLGSRLRRLLPFRSEGRQDVQEEG